MSDASIPINPSRCWQYATYRNKKTGRFWVLYKSRKRFVKHRTGGANFPIDSVFRLVCSDEFSLSKSSKMKMNLSTESHGLKHKICSHPGVQPQAVFSTTATAKSRQSQTLHEDLTSRRQVA